MKKERGFTLLELMIAVFILVVMSLLIWQLTSQTVRSRRTQGQYAEIYQSARVAMRRISDDLSMAYLATPTFTSSATDGTILMDTTFIGEENAIHFNTFSHWRYEKDIHESDQAEVSYYVEAEKDDPDNLLLMRRESAVVDKDVKEGGGAFPIAEGIKELKFKYYQQTANEWLPDWNSKDPRTPNKLPRAVLVSLKYKDPRDPQEEIEFKTGVLLELFNAQIDF